VDKLHFVVNKGEFLGQKIEEIPRFMGLSAFVGS
jgi:hypothetical protein